MKVFSYVKAKRKAYEIGCEWKVKSWNCILDLVGIGKFKILDKKDFSSEISIIWKLKVYKGHGKLVRIQWNL